MNQILFLSNDPVLKKKNIEVLSENGFRVTESSEGLDAVVMVGKHTYDAVIVDEELADVDGYRASKKIGEHSNIPIILLGTEPDEQAWARSRETGFALYLRKPISPRELTARVKSLLRRTLPEEKSKPVEKETPTVMQAGAGAIRQQEESIQLEDTVKPAQTPQVRSTPVIQTSEFEIASSDKVQRVYCPKCGAENLPAQRFCGTCTARLCVEPKTSAIPMQQKTVPTHIQEVAEPAKAPEKMATIEPAPVKPLPETEAIRFEQTVICPKCGYRNPINQPFCGGCASKLGAEEQTITAAAAMPTQKVREQETAEPAPPSPAVGQIQVPTTVQPVSPATEVRQLETMSVTVTPLPEMTQEAVTDEKTAMQIWEDARVAKLVDALVSGRISEITPMIDIAEKEGFAYPDVDRLLGTSAQDTVRILETLANQDILNKKPFEKLSIDPDGSLQLLPVERCPYCNSGKLTKGQLIEHFSCGNVGLEQDYKKNHHYICPKCNRELKLLGTDYHNVGLQYMCLECNELFPMPATKWRSIKTGKIWGADELREIWLYSYTLKQGKRDWLEFQLQPKAQLVDFLRFQGYQVEELAQVLGHSGAVHTIDMLATKDDGIAKYYVGIGILTAKPVRTEVSLDDVFEFDTKAYDMGINYKIVIAMPKMAPEATKFAERQGIGVYEVKNPAMLVPFFRNRATGPSPAVLAKAKAHLLTGMGTADSPKAQLIAFLRSRGYEVFEQAKIRGKSGVDHIFDVFAQRDDGIIKPSMVVAIATNDDRQPVGMDKVAQFDAETRDANIRNRVFIGAPQLSPQARQFAAEQGIRALEEAELAGLVRAWTAI